MRMDSKQLRNFLAIVEKGSFTRAAEAVNMSQPALSASIAQLEQTLGVPVFVRGKSGATPTSFGRLLVRHARAVNNALTQGETEIALKRQGITGPLSVGGTPVAMISFASRALTHMTREFGPVAASLRELSDSDLPTMLRSEEIDIALGVVSLDAPEPDIVEEILVQAPYDVVVASDHPLAGRSSVDIAEIANLTWAVPEAGGAFRRQLESLFAVRGVPFPSAQVVCGSLAILKEVVRSAHCISVLPHPAVTLELAAGLLSQVKLEGDHAPRAFGFKRLRNRELSVQAQAFASALRASVN